MDLPVPEGQKKEMSFASHATMSKSFGTQRKTLARVITLEKKVDVLEKSGITQELFQDINQSILNINQSLLGIRDIIAEDIAVDKEIERDQDKADQQQLDAQKKQGAEKFLELETEKELVEPVEKGTKNVKSVFQRFMDAMLALFGGWMIDKLGKALEAWNEGDTDKLKEIAKNVTTALGVVGGIFLAQSALVGGISGAISGIATGILFNIPAAIAIMANPLTWIAMAAIVASVGAWFIAKKAGQKYEERIAEIEKNENLSLVEKSQSKKEAFTDFSRDMTPVVAAGSGSPYGGMAYSLGTEMMASRDAHQKKTDSPLMAALRTIQRDGQKLALWKDDDKALLNKVTNTYRQLAMIEEALMVLQNELANASNSGDEAKKAKLLENKKKLELAFKQTKENLISLKNSTDNEIVHNIINTAKEHSVFHLGEHEKEEHKDLGWFPMVADILEESRFRQDQKSIVGPGWADVHLFGNRFKNTPKLDFDIERDILNPNGNFLNSDGKWEDLSSSNTKDDTLISQSVDGGVDIEVVPIETSGGNGTKGSNSLVKGNANDKELTQLATSNGNDPYDLFYGSVYGLG